MISEMNGQRTTFDSVRHLLETGRTLEARNLALATKSRPPELQNALGVCWLRLGETAKAVDLYRTMVLVEGGVCFRAEAPANAVINYATALLLSGNLAGCEATLDSNPEIQGPAVTRLRGAISKWRSSLGGFRRLMIALGGPAPEVHIPLDYPPGEL